MCELSRGFRARWASACLLVMSGLIACSDSNDPEDTPTPAPLYDLGQTSYFAMFLANDDKVQADTHLFISINTQEDRWLSGGIFSHAATLVLDGVPVPEDEPVDVEGPISAGDTFTLDGDYYGHTLHIDAIIDPGSSETLNAYYDLDAGWYSGVWGMVTTDYLGTY